MTETGMVLAEIRFHLKHLPRWARTKNVRTPMTQFHAKSFVVPEPYGVVLVMSPWNYPLQLCLVSLTGAISAGNCVVVKPSAYAPATSGAIAEIICGIFPPEYIAVVDGHDGMGMVVGHKAMTMAVEKAKKYGMGMVAVRNSTHYGIAGYYASMAAKENMIGITGTNARPSIAPTFGVENMLGTNPLTFGIPTDEEFPFVLDCATSITQRGKIEYFAREGKDTPAGMVIGHDGKPMTDSAAILDALVKETAALAPLGGMGEELAGYKGYGYATVVEILSAALQAGSYMKMLTGLGDHGEKVPHRLGHFFIAIDTEAFVGAESFKKTAGDILRALRASALAPGESRIYTAGEKEYLAWLERKDKGVPVGEAVQKEFIAVRDQLGLPHRFPFE